MSTDFYYTHFLAFMGSKTWFTLWKWFPMWSTKVDSESPFLCGHFDTKIVVVKLKTETKPRINSNVQVFNTEMLQFQSEVERNIITAELLHRWAGEKYPANSCINFNIHKMLGQGLGLQEQELTGSGNITQCFSDVKVHSQGMGQGKQNYI